MLTTTTKLEAVNVLLDTIGQSMVNTLEGEVSLDVKRAITWIDAVSRELQLVGCTFNSEEEYPLARNTNGEILVPSNMVSIVVPKTFPLSLVIRGTRLYDRTNHTYTFESDVTADVILLLDFDDLPQYAKWFITVRAARKFTDTSTQSEVGHKFNQEDEYAAMREFKRQEGIEDNERTFLGQPSTLLNAGKHRRLTGR